jgi:PAS domain S-box-containing protein
MSQLQKNQTETSPVVTPEFPEAFEKLYHAIFQGTNNAIVILDADRRIRQVNDQAGSLFGMDPDDLVGEECCRFLVEGRNKDIHTMLDAIDGDAIKNEELILHTKSGEERPVRITAAQIPMNGSYIYQLLFMDLYEKRQFQVELEEREEQVEEMQVTLRNVMQTMVKDKREFHADMAHQIKIELLPALERMAREPTQEMRENYKQLLQEHLMDLAGETSSTMDAQLLKLTPTEIRVCKFIMGGQGTKQIAELMNSAFETIQTHRKNIRKKLGLKGKKITLYSYLQTKHLGPEEQVQ